ncbi:nucleotidyl transferase AbiEii/AbiGii toxin family protein [Streptomonospora litoralis]|uniref:Nucleotidyl transferase AbiEii/AbiGii toxin family protein n=1 Tax=Streptomonospora litoralis TaxID=2498135 RepID=A0A4P6Q615_9ACTN|nr:nucleotidyl transferase AbiEii/AbiGii toxin family protein [Streptomonospora litoralis]QBI56198.1 hypothetical protein EKD16_22225 [Streptomonospora litoralis]
MTLPYTTPTAFRRALTERLRAAAKPNGPWPLAELQRQFAYDRLLARLYHLDTGWIVKGATALLARELAVRRTVDIDVYRPGDRGQAEHDLRRAAALDLGDWFIFETGRATPVSDGANGVRIPTTARIGTTEWVRFHVDVVAEDIRMTGSPEDVPPLPAVAILGLDRPGYRVYPLADHIADKTCAILERHGPEKRPSTRFKDLVDMLAVLGSQYVAAANASPNTTAPGATPSCWNAAATTTAVRNERSRQRSGAPPCRWACNGRCRSARRHVEAALLSPLLDGAAPAVAVNDAHAGRGPHAA